MNLEEKTAALRRLLEETRTAVDASRLEHNRQRKRIGEVLREIESSEVLIHRSAKTRSSMAEVAKLEKVVSGFSTLEKAGAVRVLLEPMASWNENAKALMRLIDLEVQHKLT